MIHLLLYCFLCVLLPAQVALLDEDGFSRYVTGMLLDRVEAIENHVELQASDEVIALALSPQGRDLRLILVSLNSNGIDKHNDFDAELLASIRNQTRFCNIAIVGIAEADSPWDSPNTTIRNTKANLLLKSISKSKLKSKGFDDIIIKPPTVGAMIALVAKYMNNRVVVPGGSS
jgi:hypothetical protein